MTPQTSSDTVVLDRFFAHNTWSNLKLLDFCAQLDDAQLDSTAIGGYGSIRKTLSHILRAEIGYVTRVTGDPSPVALVPGQLLTIDEMREAARWTGRELLRLATGARTETRVTEESDTERVDYSLASLIVQAITHSVEHRTQINSVITSLGLEPPDLSGWNYMEESGEFHIVEK